MACILGNASIDVAFCTVYLYLRNQLIFLTHKGALSCSQLVSFSLLFMLPVQFLLAPLQKLCWKFKYSTGADLMPSDAPGVLTYALL